MYFVATVAVFDTPSKSTSDVVDIWLVTDDLAGVRLMNVFDVVGEIALLAM
jgi:hypothetical protein